MSSQNNVSQLYPSLEDMLIGKVITNKESFEDVKRTFLQPTPTSGKSGKNITSNYKNLYSELSNELLSISNSTPNKTLIDIPIGTPIGTSINTKFETKFETKNEIVQNTPLTVAEKISNSMHHLEGVREAILIKQTGYSLGLAFVEINTSYYVAFVEQNSVASQAKIRFGDQIVRINSLEMAGTNNKIITNYIKNLPDNEVIHFIIRDRPWHKVYKLMKDADELIGIHIKNGNIVSLLKDSSCSRNGIPTDHQIIEINSQNVIGMSDAEIVTILKQSGRDIYLSLMPINIYSKLISKIGNKKLKTQMDHSFMYC